MKPQVYGLLLAISICPYISHADEYVRDLTKPKGADPLFQVRRGAKWGFMDSSGRTVIMPTYDDVGHFFNHLARVRVGNTWGFIDEAGSVVIRPRFAATGDFTGELAPVQIGRKWGYIDRSGRMVIAPIFQGAASFHEGLARVEMWDWIQCGVGSVYSNEDAPLYVFGMQSDIHHGMNNNCYPLRSRVGFLDATGHFVIRPQFVEAHDFAEGMAVVRLELTGRFGFIDRRGVVVIPCQFDEARGFSEGVAAVRVGRYSDKGFWDPGRCGYVDRSGRFSIRPQFASAGDFTEGLAAVSFWDRQGRGYIDKSGRLVIPARFQNVEPFSEGLAAVCHQAHSTFWRCEYIDKTGRTMIDSVQANGPFRNGLAIAQQMKEQASQSVYIDKAGKVIATSETNSPNETRVHRLRP